LFKLYSYDILAQVKYLLSSNIIIRKRRDSKGDFHYHHGYK